MIAPPYCDSMVHGPWSNGLSMSMVYALWLPPDFCLLVQVACGHVMLRNTQAAMAVLDVLVAAGRRDGEGSPGGRLQWENDKKQNQVADATQD